ncbi:anti-sigma factor domain-containing protein [Sphingomonas sp. BK345]|uniref:anti-sigma factor n=1 Tax=Sphingomonas sp. BK345 TaxID=2586980 RepID=UPI001611F385|nr:anti-sigma factor [Sphingomonas sp. BK345]MBB3473729.1 anti-sigma-K factor RskA [Sphingomonas sp. BK345]
MTPDDQALAAELALGVLDGAELAAARARLAADRAFAAEVARWEEWLAPLALAFPETSPPAGLEARVLAAIDVPGAAPRAGWRRRGSLALAGLAAAVLALVVGPLRAPPPPPVPAPTRPAAAPLLAALVVPAGAEAPGRAPLAAAVDRTSGEVRIAAATVPRGRSAELWAIAEGGAPVALGLLDGGRPTRLVVAQAQRVLLRAGTTLAVSIEPPGGSPGAAPTGPVVAAGALSEG